MEPAVYASFVEHLGRMASDAEVKTAAQEGQPALPDADPLLDEYVQRMNRAGMTAAAVPAAGGAALTAASFLPKGPVGRWALRAPGIAGLGLGALMGTTVPGYNKARGLVARQLQGGTLTPDEEAQLRMLNPSGSMVGEMGGVQARLTGKPVDLSYFRELYEQPEEGKTAGKKTVAEITKEQAKRHALLGGAAGAGNLSTAVKKKPGETLLQAVRRIAGKKKQSSVKEAFLGLFGPPREYVQAVAATAGIPPEHAKVYVRNLRPHKTDVQPAQFAADIKPVWDIKENQYNPLQQGLVATQQGSPEEAAYLQQHGKDLDRLYGSWVQGQRDLMTRYRGG